MEKTLNSFTLSALPDQPSSKSSSFSAIGSGNGCTSPVVELQSKFFPIQPRGGNLSARDLRNAGILPAMSMDSSSGSSSSSSTTSSTIPLGKLKEPRDLYSTATLLHPIKWPVECQVIPEKIRHIDSTPHKLEPFYSPTGKEPQAQPVGVEMGTVVYDYQPKLSVDYFCRATVGGSQDFDEYDNVHNPSESAALRFESRFESGNLAKAIKVTNMYYELYLRPDLYTERHAQWFYFRIQNTKEGLQYRFSIVNFNKPDSLYRYGLKVLMYSEKEAQLNQLGWTRCGQNIAYFKNDISPDDNGPYYTLTFNLKFKHNNDTVYLAQSYPYTYSTLQNYLKSIEDDEFKSQLLTIRLLCRSLAGNNVHVLTVTSPDNQQSLGATTTMLMPAPQSTTPTIAPPISTTAEEEPALPNANKKPVIVISARVHPGESQSSYMMKGIIDFLTSDCSQAKDLRDRFIFKLIPMLNPDGVIVGNSRCCLLGQDLNRQYRTVLREAFPQIYHAKVMLRRLQEENGIFLYCDLHGHSRRHNVFIYGCENRRVPERKLVEQVFPLMMHKNAADKFSFQNCKFKIQKNKEGTGRIFVWTLGVVNSYTLEISLGGSTMPSRPYTHFNTSDYEACGRHFCETLLDYSDPNPMKENLRDRILQKLVDEGSTADEPKNVVLSDYSSLSHSETDGEDNDDRDDEDSSPETVNSSLMKSLTSSGVSSGSFPSSSTNTSTSSLKQLKRQVSWRKHHNQHPPPFQNRTKSAGRTQSKVVSESTRSPLPIHRASVDFTKIKQRKLEDTFVLQTQATVPPPSPINIEDDAETLPLSTKEVSAAYRRLTKFRRKSRKHNGSYLYTSSIENSDYSRNYSTQQPYHLTAKCTRIIFDDPFNPPGTSLQKPYRHKRASRFTGEPLEAFDLNSGTEDECDPYDNMSGAKRFPETSAIAPIIKITDCGGDTFSSNSISEDLHTLAGEMARLEVSGKQQRSSSDSESQPNCQPQTLPSFAPFVPSFPVGKAYLHQTFYPDKSSSPRGGKGDAGKLTNSLSDTTIATNALTGTSPTSTPNSGHFKQMSAMPTARRSSISYMGGGGTLNKGRLLATGTTMLGSREPIPSSRRRVSWTGTLTVSVPTVTPNPAILKSPTTGHNLNRKSFRKSKSLNDKSSAQASQQQRQSSTDMTDSAGSLVASGSLDKIPSGTLSQGSGNVRGKFGSVPLYSQSTGSLATGVPATSLTKKRKCKLKRSKNK